MDEATFEAVFGQWLGEEGQTRYMRNLAQFDERYIAEFELLLGSMQTPIRIIWGERDAWLAPAFASRLRELLPNSDLKLIPEAGHFVMEAVPTRWRGSRTTSSAWADSSLALIHPRA